MKSGLLRTAWYFSLTVASLIWVFNGSSAEAGCGCPVCVKSVAYQTVHRTVYRQTVVPEQRTVNVTEYHPEVHERTVQVHRCVPETKQVTRTHTVMVPHQKTKTVTYHVSKPVWEELDQQYTVMVPHQEQRTGIRTVCRPVQVQTTRRVCQDQGYWQHVTHRVACCRHGCHRCGGCCYVNVTRKVWCSKPVIVEVPVTVMKNEYVQQPYQYTVTVCHPEIRTRKVRVCRYVSEPQSKQVTYTEYVPEQRQHLVNVTTYKTLVENKVERYTVMVPHTVQKQVTVMVCKVVPQTVVCQIPIISYCCP